MLQAAVGHGQPNIVAQLLAAGTCAIDAPDRRGRTPLFRAAMNGHAVVVRQLLGASAAVDAVDKMGPASPVCGSRQGPCSSSAAAAG